MIEESRELVKFINTISRITQAYTDDALKKFNLSSGTYPFLFVLSKKEGISQNQISKELCIDKAASARSIKKLIDLAYIRKEEDKEDSRAYKLFLTEKGRILVPKIHKEICGWINLITAGIDKDEQEKLIKVLDNVLINAKEYKLKNKEE